MSRACAAFAAALLACNVQPPSAPCQHVPLACIMSASAPSCPPADCPTRWNDSPSPPKAAALRSTHAMPVLTSHSMSSALPCGRRARGGRREAPGDERPLPLCLRSPSSLDLSHHNASFMLLLVLPTHRYKRCKRHLGKISVVQTEHQHAALAQPPRQQRPPGCAGRGRTAGVHVRALAHSSRQAGLQLRRRP